MCIAYYTRLPILFKEIFFYIKKIVLFKIVTEFFKCRGGDERCLRRVVRNIKRENRKSESYDLNFADGAEEVMNPSRCHSAFHPVILPSTLSFCLAAVILSSLPVILSGAKNPVSKGETLHCVQSDTGGQAERVILLTRHGRQGMSFCSLPVILSGAKNPAI